MYTGLIKGASGVAQITAPTLGGESLPCPYRCDISCADCVLIMMASQVFSPTEPLGAGVSGSIYHLEG